MTTETTQARGVTFNVLDAMDAPHEGRILRLRLQTGEAPSIRAIRGSRLVARAPDGRTVPLRVEGFALFGGRPSDERLARTGRVDVHVTEEGDEGPVGLRWSVTLA